jgi:IS4 transposase
MKTDNPIPENPSNFSSRESLLKANSELIEILQKRINVKRFRVQEGDSIKLGYIRALIQALQVQNEILKDTEIDEIKRELKKTHALGFKTIEELQKMDIHKLTDEEILRLIQVDCPEFKTLDELTDDILEKIVTGKYP